jgi:hypothetical protein
LTAPKGLAIDGSGNLFIADSGNSRIVVVGPTGSGSVLSTGAVSLNAPQGLANRRSRKHLHCRYGEQPDRGSACNWNSCGVRDHRLEFAIHVKFPEGLSGGCVGKSLYRGCGEQQNREGDVWRGGIDLGDHGHNPDHSDRGGG